MHQTVEFIEVEQKFKKSSIKNIKETIEKEIRNNPSVNALPLNAEIAITAGSRGISNIAEILREIVNVTRELGYRPFLIPAMGSHGGATAEGQLKVLEHLGISEETMGAEIRSSMDVELISHTETGVPVYMDKNAYGADGIIVVNRVKAHTAFHGRVESGLSKMVTIGLGKIRGASFVHMNGANQMAENIENVCESALRNSPIVMGLAIVENGYDETAEIVGVTPGEWFEKEAELLIKSKKLMPRLPTDKVDVLIIEEMGKVFSGTGMDPNIIGRMRIDGVEEPKFPDIKRIAVFDLAEKSFGNAQGIGLADFTTQKLVDKVDRKATYTNALTSTFLRRAMLPFIYETEMEAVETAFSSLGPEVNVNTLKVIQIPNTLHLDRLFVTKPVLEEMEKSDIDFEVRDTFTVEYTNKLELARRLTNN